MHEALEIVEDTFELLKDVLSKIAVFCCVVLQVERIEYHKV